MPDTVQKSLMPKGVDHTAGLESIGIRTVVQKSLMPKGVDHYRSFLDALTRINPVQKSLMPKGVDHTVQIDCRDALEGAKIFDAERR